MARSSIKEPVSLDEFSGNDTTESKNDNGVDGSIVETIIEDGGTAETGDGGTAETGDGVIGEQKRRGRKPGTKNKEKTDTNGIKGLSSILFAVHVSLAGILKSPTFMLTQEECDRLAEASNNVAKHYNLGLTDKQRDIAALVFCAGSIYAPRIYQLRQEKKLAAKSQ